MKKLIHCIKSMIFRKRGKDEINRKFNFKLKSHDNWDDTFDYPYLCDIIEVLLPKISVSYFYLNQTSADSTVRVLSVSRFCPDFPENPVRCLSAVRILSGFSVRCLSVRILSVSILSAVRILSGFLENKLSGVCLSGSYLSRFCQLSGFCPDF